jgi:hypothetical protein
LISASISKYALRVGQSSISPSNWTVRFLDVDDIEVGSDTRTSESFTSNQSREFDIAASAVRKAILTIDSVPADLRPTLATFVNSSSLVEISPVNNRRFDHDPITLAPKGLLIEEARSNLIFDVVPLRESVNVEISSAVSPTGAMDAFEILATTNISYHSLPYRKWVTAGTCTFSAFVKAAGENEVMTNRLYDDQIIISLQTGSFATSNPFTGIPQITGSVQKFGNGWYRCAMTIPIPAENTKLAIWPRPRNMANMPVTESQGYLFGASN